MSAIQGVLDQLNSSFSRVGDQVKKRVLGENNENIEFIMDSFYKLSPSQQSGVLLGVSSGLAVFVFISLWF